MFNKYKIINVLIILSILFLMVGSTFSQPLTTKDSIFDIYTCNPVNTNITIDPVSDLSGDTNISAVLKSMDNEILENETLLFYLDDNLIGTQKTNLNGSASIRTYHGGLSKGNHRLTVRYEGNQKFSPSDATVNIKLAKEKLNISVSDVRCNYGESPLITVKLTSSTKRPVPNKQIVFSFVENDSYIGEVTSDINGKVSLNYVQNLKPGTYLLRAKFRGDNQYEVGSETFYLTVDKLNATISMDNITTALGFNCTITAKLIGDPKSPPGTPLFGQNITFYYENGTPIGSQDVRFKGDCSCPVTFNKVGNFTLVAKSEGNDYYNPTNTTSKAIVKGIRTKLTMWDSRGYNIRPGRKAKLYAMLTDRITGEPIANKIITFREIKNEIIGTNITDEYGYAQLDYRLPYELGKYLIGSSYDPGIEESYSSSNGMSYVRIFNPPWFVQMRHRYFDQPPKKPPYDWPMSKWRDLWGYYD